MFLIQFKRGLGLRFRRSFQYLWLIIYARYIMSCQGQIFLMVSTASIRLVTKPRKKNISFVIAACFLALSCQMIRSDE